MSDYRAYPPASPRLIGYDPALDLSPTHLARLVDQVVEAAITPPQRLNGKGRPPFDPRLCLKVLIYGYCTGIRSSRQMERLCRESLPYLLLTRGDTPCYRFTRVDSREQIELVWSSLFAVAKDQGLTQMGRIVVDSSKFRANASPEAVLKQDEYEPMRAELTRILAESVAIDAREDQEGAPVQTDVRKSVASDQMRDIVRRVRSAQAEIKRREAAALATTPPTAPPGEGEKAPAEALALTIPLTSPMRARIEQAIAAIDAAQKEERKHVCVTDPDARMLGEGRSKPLKECHGFEIATDNGLIVAAGVTTEPDNGRLLPLVEAAAKNEPEGVTSVDADSGYWGSDAIATLENAAITTCIPTTQTACDLRRGLPVGTTLAGIKGSVPFTYDAATDTYHCPEGNSLIFIQQRRQDGQTVCKYRASAPCDTCSRAGECLKNKGAKRRY